MKNIKLHLGFTLVELLIAISIVAILTTVGARLYLNSVENGLDSKRVKDLESLKQALELYHQSSRSYPSAMSEVVPKYLDSLPQDPKISTGRNYQYKALPVNCTTDARDCSKFIICAKTDGNQTAGVPTDCNLVTCNSNSGDCNYGVASNEYDKPFILPSPTPVSK